MNRVYYPLAVGLIVLMSTLVGHAQQPSSAAQASAPPNLKIVKLLWKAQPAGAATALEKALDQAITRREVALLPEHLKPLADQFAALLSPASEDPRWVGSVAAMAILGDQAGRDALTRAVTQSPTPLPIAQTKRELLLRTWLAIDADKAKEYVQSIIASDKVWTQSDQADIDWLEVLVLRGIESDKAATTANLIRRWSAMPRSVQLAAVEPLTQTAASMKQLVSAIDAGNIPKDLLNTNQLLKWNAGSDAELKQMILKVWGRLRSSEDTNRKQVVSDTLKLLTSGKSGDAIAGEAHFKRICFQCHKLHGQGMEVGPDITGNGRGSFEQLVSNVMDPSLVIGQAFTSKTVLTTDGRVLAGLVAADDPKRLTLKVQGGKLIELDREDDIEQIKESDKSLMPDGLEQQMKEQELLDLFAYLSLVRPLAALENSTIPGTPEKLIK